MSFCRMSYGVGCSSGISNSLMMSAGIVAIIFPMSVCFASVCV